MRYWNIVKSYMNIKKNWTLHENAGWWNSSLKILMDWKIEYVNEPTWMGHMLNKEKGCLDPKIDLSQKDQYIVFYLLENFHYDFTIKWPVHSCEVIRRKSQSPLGNRSVMSGSEYYSEMFNKSGSLIQVGQLKLEPQGALIAHLSTMGTSVIS